MDIKRLTHILALAEKRNFARAAEQLHLTQPALTRSIQVAEAEFGLRLFDRGSLEVRPTPAGEFVIARARRLVFDSRNLSREVDLYRDAKLGDTAFGMGPLPAATFLAAVLIEFRTTHPGVNLRVEVGNWEQLAKRLRDEDIEFFVGDMRNLPSASDFVVRTLPPERAGLYVRTGHPLAARKSVPLSDVWSYGIASVRIPSDVRSKLAILLALSCADDVPIAIECDDVDTLKRVTAATNVILAATHATVHADLEQGSLVQVSAKGFPALHTRMGIVTLRGRTLSPMASLIVDRLPGLIEDAIDSSGPDSRSRMPAARRPRPR